MVQVTVLFHTDEFILFGLSKTETGSKTDPRVHKLGYYDDGRVQKLSSRVTFAKSGAGVVCHILFLDEAVPVNNLKEGPFP